MNISDRRLTLSLPHLLIVIVVLIPTLLAMSSATATQDNSLGANHDAAMDSSFRMAPPPPTPPIGPIPKFNWPPVAVDDSYIIHHVDSYYGYNIGIVELPVKSNDFDREGDWFEICHVYGPAQYMWYWETFPNGSIWVWLPLDFVGTVLFEYDMCDYQHQHRSNFAIATLTLPGA